jgi:hypothetical protein
MMYILKTTSMYQIKSTHMVYFLKTAKVHLLGKFYTTFIGV